MSDLNVFLLTEVASTTGFFVALGLIALFLLSRKEWRRARAYIVSGLGLAITTALLKLVVAAPRPAGGLVETDSYAFPSGHAAGIMFLALSACVLAFRLPRLARYAVYLAAIALTVAIGTSRVYFVVHTPLQVFAGYAIGALWVFVFLRLIETKR